MPYELFLAIRYLRSRRKRRLARITSALAVLGVGIGVAALIVALALANGFRDEMREKILRGTAHINVMRSDGRPITGYQDLSSKLKTISGITTATATTYDGAVLIGPHNSAYAVLRGIDTESPGAIAEVEKLLVEGSAEQVWRSHKDQEQLAAVLIGSELAERTGVGVGDTAQIVSANSALTAAGPIKRPVRVAGIFRADLFEYDSSWIYLSLDAATRFYEGGPAASVISVQLLDIYQAKQVAANIRADLGASYQTIDWEEANRPLFNALALERRMGAVVIALIILIASLNITTTLVLIVVERRRDIGILSALGAAKRSIMIIFLMQGAVVGVLGAIAGVILGGLACFIGNRYQLVSLPAEVYSVSNVPFHAHGGDIMVAALAAFLLSVAATIYPARVAARVRPGEMLRDAN